MNSRVGLIVFVLVTAAGAVAHGRYTGRWVALPPLDEFTGRLDRLPPAAGEWVAENRPLEDADTLGRAGIAGYSHRVYRHRKSGQTVTVLVVCGRPGPISVHTPDVCYRGLGYVAVADPERQPVAVPGGPPVPLWYLRFRPPVGRPDQSELEIRWAWVTPTAGRVEAPAVARVAYAGEPALYKVYVISERPAVAGAGGPDVPAFMAAYLPQLGAVVGPTGPNR